jgi:hypothetical protein
MGKHDEQLAWEQRMAKPVAVSAVLAGLLLIQPLFLVATLRKDRPNVEATPDYLLSLHDSTAGFIASTAGQAIGALLLIPVFWLLFRATRYRSPEVPDVFKYLVVAGPVLYAVSSMVGLFDRIDVADQFASGLPVAGKAGADRADDLLDNPNGLVIGLAFAGTLALAFIYVMVPLRASRVGLLSRFMGILGVITGALLVLPLLPGGQAIVQLFWLAAVAALVLNKWPNGRGPAWDSGEAEPWPTPQRRGMMSPPDSAPAEPDPEPDGPPQRKSSRKKRR